MCVGGAHQAVICVILSLGFEEVPACGVPLFFRTSYCTVELMLNSLLGMDFCLLY